MCENSMLEPRICPHCFKEIEYDGSCACKPEEDDDE